MKREEAINVLKTRSCYECTWGCDSPVSCHCGGCDLAEATSIAIESLETFGWIPVTERLPEDTGKYLVTVKNGNVYAGTYDKFSGTFQCAATAWMELPEPYGEVEE